MPSGKKRTHGEFVSELSKINSTIQVLGTYEKNVLPVLCRCSICNYNEESVSKVRRGRAESTKQQLTRDNPLDEILRIDPSLRDFITYVQGLDVPRKTEWRDYDAERLFNRVHNDDGLTRQRLIELYLDLALRTALLHSKHFDCEIAEAVSLAYTGVVLAANKYNPDEDYSFTQLCSAHVYASLSRGIVSKYGRMKYTARTGSTG